MSIILPESMVSGVENLAKNRNCSKSTVVKLAIAKFLFDQTLSSPKIFEDKNETKQFGKIQRNIDKEIPLDKIVSVQYTLDDGRVIHVVRESKMR